jgi:hypothetical protein
MFEISPLGGVMKLGVVIALCFVFVSAFADETSRQSVPAKEIVKAIPSPIIVGGFEQNVKPETSFELHSVQLGVFAGAEELHPAPAPAVGRVTLLGDRFGSQIGPPPPSKGRVLIGCTEPEDPALAQYDECLQ